MDNPTIKKILQISCGATLIIGLITFYKLDIEIQSIKAITTCSGIVSGIAFFWISYFSFFWKVPYFNLILYKENLNGTWFGSYDSTNFTTKNKSTGEIVIIIRQNFLNLNVKSFTEDYINYSFGEVVNYDSKSESHQLIYLYSQSEFTPTDDKNRKGTSELKLLEELKDKKLFGDFWTNHNSKGRLSFKRISKKHSTSFKEAKLLIKK
jgi:hypothetical protein